MSKIVLINASCADQTVDAVVNAANSGLWAGGGICGVIFKKAGMTALTAACAKYQTPLKDGSAVITPAFNMTNTKYIIHAIGPDFGRTPTAFKELFDAYYNSLCVLKDNGLHSISFPLISSGIFGGSLPNPSAESTQQCCRAYKQFIADFPDYPVDVKLCAFSAKQMLEAETVFSGIHGRESLPQWQTVAHPEEIRHRIHSGTIQTELKKALEHCAQGPIRFAALHWCIPGRQGCCRPESVAIEFVFSFCDDSKCCRS